VELDAMEVASVELIDGADLSAAELAGNTRLVDGSACRAQRRHLDAGGTELGDTRSSAGRLRGVRKPMGWSVWMEVAWRRALRGTGASGGRGS